MGLDADIVAVAAALFSLETQILVIAEFLCLIADKTIQFAKLRLARFDPGDHIDFRCLQGFIALLYKFRCFAIIDSPAPVGTVALIHIADVESHHRSRHQFSFCFKRLDIFGVWRIAGLETTSRRERKILNAVTQTVIDDHPLTFPHGHSFLHVFDHIHDGLIGKSCQLAHLGNLIVVLDAAQVIIQSLCTAGLDLLIHLF